MTITATPILPLRTEAEAAQLACRFARAQGYGAGINVIATGRPDDYGAVEASRCIGGRCAHWLAYRETAETRVKCEAAARHAVVFSPPDGDGWQIVRSLSGGTQRVAYEDGCAIAQWSRATRGRCGLVLIDMRPFEVAP